MSNFENKDIPLPAKKEGKQKDIQADIDFDTIDAAKDCFGKVKERLLDINNWGEISGEGSAEFQLTDAQGEEVHGPPKIGYHIRINVPGPGSITGRGYDWVNVELISTAKNLHQDSEYLIIRVRPCANPQKNNREIAHFFSHNSTSNFLVMREGKKITAAVLGRNEMVNTKLISGFLNKLRNAVVGVGAALGLANPQWKKLVNGLLANV